MRKILTILLALALLLPLVGQAQAAGQSYTFDGPQFALTLPEGAYSVVLTPQNLKDNEAFLTTEGETVEQAQQTFEAKGILLKAYDAKEKRVLVVTALKDVDAQQYFDINEQTPAMRAEYRKQHADREGPYSLLGYRYTAAEWKNFKTVGRFLMLRYTLKQDGATVCQGFQRRSIRNGYTITIDVQVFGRTISGRDNTALNKVFDTLTFTGVDGLPDLATPLSLNEMPPEETDKPDFTIKGVTKPKAQLTASLISYQSSQATTFEATANNGGAFSMKVKLPDQGTYILTLTVKAEGAEDLVRTYAITYQKGLLPVTMTEELPKELTADSYTLSGTTIAGASVQLVVNDRSFPVKKVTANKKFSFTIVTSREGSYNISLTVSKEGLTNKVLVYNPTRVFDEAQKDKSLRDSAIRPIYANLLAKPDGYDGRLVTFEGIVTDKAEKAGEWLITMALKQVDGAYSEFMILTQDTEPTVEVGSRQRMFGVSMGLTTFKGADGQESQVPKFQLKLLDPVASGT